MKKKKKARHRHQKRPDPGTAIVKAAQPILSVPEAIEKVLILGDLSSLTPTDRIDYYNRVCRSLALNPLTMPFTYILFREGDGGPAKLSLYANKSCTEQLRKIHGVSVIPPFRKSRLDGIVTVEVDVRDRTGRTDTASGSVPLFKYKNDNRIDLSGKDLCNAEMKCETKAKRRATLSICGLAFLDESELDTMEVLGGVTPEGRIYRYDGADPRQGSREAAQRVLEAKLASGNPNPIEPEIVDSGRQESRPAPSVGAPTKLPESAYNKENVPQATKAEPWKYAGVIELDFIEDKTMPYVRGDIAELAGHFPKDLTLRRRNDFWCCFAEDVPRIKLVANAQNFRVNEVLPTPPAKSKEAKTKPINAKPKAKQDSAGPRLAKGIIERVISGMTGNNNPLRNVTMLLPDKRKPTFGCFDKGLFEWLDKGNGKPAELYVQTRGKYTNIVGLKLCAGKEFVDGKTPVIQRKDQEAGARTLFNT